MKFYLCVYTERGWQGDEWEGRFDGSLKIGLYEAESAIDAKTLMAQKLHGDNFGLPIKEDYETTKEFKDAMKDYKKEQFEEIAKIIENIDVQELNGEPIELKIRNV